MPLSRRAAMLALSASLAGWPWKSPARAAVQGKSLSFAFSLYGMRTLPLDRALRVCADIGYSGVELACMTGWPCDPVTLDAAARKTLRQQLDALSLELPALMDNIRLVVPDDEHRANLERWKSLTQLAQDLAWADGPPLIETVLGGKPDEWDRVRETMVDRLRDWERVAARARVVIAIKGHVSNAAHRPEDVLWLVQQVGSPWIKAVFDYSHFERQGIPLGASLRQLLPETVFIHVKDNVTTKEGKTEFALPGEGPTNYDDYLRLLLAARYHGSICVEVSAQVSSKPGYNAIIAAEQSYLNLRTAFERTGQRARI